MTPDPFSDSSVIGIMAGAGNGGFLLPFGLNAASGVNIPVDGYSSLPWLLYLPWVQGGGGDPHDLYPLMPEIWSFIANLDKRGCAR
jgi:hypothetical protein